MERIEHIKENVVIATDKPTNEAIIACKPIVTLDTGTQLLHYGNSRLPIIEDKDKRRPYIHYYI